MGKAISVDIAKGTVQFKGAEKVKEEINRVGITNGQFTKLLEYAYADGFKPDATTDKGGQAQNTRVVQTYVRMAVDALIAKRG